MGSTCMRKKGKDRSHRMNSLRGCGSRKADTNSDRGLHSSSGRRGAELQLGVGAFGLIGGRQAGKLFFITKKYVCGNRESKKHKADART